MSAAARTGSAEVVSEPDGTRDGAARRSYPDIARARAGRGQLDNQTILLLLGVPQRALISGETFARLSQVPCQLVVVLGSSRGEAHRTVCTLEAPSVERRRERARAPALVDQHRAALQLIAQLRDLPAQRGDLLFEPINLVLESNLLGACVSELRRQIRGAARTGGT